MRRPHDLAARHGDPAAQAPGLLAFVAGVSCAKNLEELTRTATQAVRNLLGADGATFVLREGDRCAYVDEDAISPLWKGSRFPMGSCISGWAMLHGEAAAIRDIFKDSRVPLDAYRPTFVRSLIMAPVRYDQAIAALGAYWSTPRDISDAEVELLQALADAAAPALALLRLQPGPADGLPKAARAFTAPRQEARLPGFFEGMRRRLRSGSFAAYALAGGLVEVAALARWGLEALIGEGLAPFATFYPVVLFAKIFGGTRPAIFAAVTSALLAEWAFAPALVPFDSLATPSHLFNAGLFLATSLLMVWMLTRYRRAMSRLADEEALHASLAREIQHRLRNALSVIQTIVNQSLRGNPAQAAVLNQRIWAGVSDLTLDPVAPARPIGLQGLLQQQLQGFDLARFDFGGDDTPLPPDQHSLLALVMHELATNAVKYGALSDALGRVCIRWSWEGPHRVIRWQELDGPPVQPPSRRGYGSVFLQRLLSASGGSLALTYDPAGLLATITLPRVEPRRRAGDPVS